MTLLFFQNCISPHQMPYIEVLARHADVRRVRVVAPRVTYGDRAAMGWDDGRNDADRAADRLSVHIAPTADDVDAWLRQAVADGRTSGRKPVCLFSGITAFPEVFAWFRQSLAYDVRRAIVTEPPYLFAHPLWMHRLRFVLKDWRYVRHIDTVFAIGEGCADYYRGWSHRWRVVPFLYCTRPVDLPAASAPAEGDPCRVAFVGTLDQRKNVGLLISALSLLAQRHPEVFAHVQVTLLGDGPERSAIERQIRTAGIDAHVAMTGFRPMEETQRLLAQHDVLVLPSLHDGWGAVVNEALQLGVWPVVSDRCGARQVLTSGTNGDVFPSGRAEALATVLKARAEGVDRLRTTRTQRAQWAQTHIGPEAVAHLMLEALTSC